MFPRSEPATVLVVDDDRAVRELVRTVLRMHGYTVLEAGCGPDALRICEQHTGPIHLFLTDVLMPEMNGTDFVRQALVLHPRALVLYMSGYPDSESLLHGLPPGTAFIQKPFGPDALARKVREILRDPR